MSPIPGRRISEFEQIRTFLYLYHRSLLLLSHHHDQEAGISYLLEHLICARIVRRRNEEHIASLANHHVVTPNINIVQTPLSQNKQEARETF